MAQNLFIWATLKKLYIYIWLTGSWLWNLRSLAVACRIQLPDQGLNPGPLLREHRVLNSGPPEKSLGCFFKEPDV